MGPPLYVPIITLGIFAAAGLAILSLLEAIGKKVSSGSGSVSEGFSGGSGRSGGGHGGSRGIPHMGGVEPSPGETHEIGSYQKPKNKEAAIKYMRDKLKFPDEGENFGIMFKYANERVVATLKLLNDIKEKEIPGITDLTPTMLKLAKEAKEIYDVYKSGSGIEGLSGKTHQAFSDLILKCADELEGA